MSRPSLPLNYLASSPVRGQLEPHDPRTPQGWRWLQTTETLDQFRVLLPPATARVCIRLSKLTVILTHENSKAYEQLLASETEELAKEQPAWDHILEIRHLKDRMIRKTQRLSSSTAPKRLGRGENFAFQTVIAPEDFCLREMERWLQEHYLLPKETVANIHKRHSMQVAANRTSMTLCEKCGSVGHPLQHRCFNPMIAAAPPSFRAPPENTSSQILSPPRTSSRSPSPLPLRIRSSVFEPVYDGDNLSPDSSSPEDTGQDKPSRPPMARRRSILKRSSISDMTKTVSWADKEDLVAKIAKVSSITEETPEGSNKLESVRAAYDAQMDSLDAFQKSIEASLAQLRGEVAKLEDMESTLLEQKTILTETFLAFEKKRLELHEQVRSALEDPAQMSEPLKRENGSLETSTGNIPDESEDGEPLVLS
ncbi:hypothetical protein DL96DRAFT_1702305 [Flagelloscypha sp. PMI_526]|nr:hypothetical protein DL96DRAFT_1702305 [Flagelloscypha sp. PMI_526]